MDVGHGSDIQFLGNYNPEDAHLIKVMTMGSKHPSRTSQSPPQVQNKA